MIMQAGEISEGAGRGQHSLNSPPSFLFRYLERLVRSLVYLPFT